VRKAIPFFLTVGVVASLAACAPTDTTAEQTGDCVAVASGPASEAVKVSGDFGSKPTVEFSALAEVAETQRSVSIAGDGDEVAVEGGTASVHYSLFDATTGEEVEATPYDETGIVPLPVDAAQLPPGVVKTLECSTAGSRLVGVIPYAEGLIGDEGTNLVFVVDVVTVAAPPEPAEPPLPRADGEDQPAIDGLPTVELDDDGRPTITIPSTDPPAELEVAVLKQGDGATIAENSNVVVHYVGVNWTTGEIFDESWSRGAPAGFSTAGVVPGFKAALEGQQVGSQILAVLPPSEGYGEQGNAGAKIAGTDTIVFVVDILGVG